MFVPWGFVICLVCAGLAAALGGESCLGLDAWSSTQTELPRDPRVGAHSSRCAGSSPQGGVGCLSPTELHFVALRSAEYETRAKECDDMANATRDLNQKQLWLAVARHWHELADKIRRAGF